MAKSELKKQELEGSGKGALYDPIFVFREPPIVLWLDFYFMSQSFRQEGDLLCPVAPDHDFCR